MSGFPSACFAAFAELTAPLISAEIRGDIIEYPFSTSGLYAAVKSSVEGWAVSGSSPFLTLL